MLNPKFYKFYGQGVLLLSVFFFGRWYTEQVDNNGMAQFKNKSKLFGGRIIYPEENW
jgi:hypothetical protein